MSENLLTINMPAEGRWIVTQLSGADYLSQPFHYELTVYSDNSQVQLSALRGKAVTITMSNGTEMQTLNGVIYGIRQFYPLKNGWQQYQLTIAPRLRFLADKKQSQVFAVDQPQTVVQIVTQVLQQQDCHDFKWQLTRSYKPLNLCVQYDESPYNFIHRLLQQAGIYYYFTHADDKHTLVFSDKAKPALGDKRAMVYRSATHQSNAITRWRACVGLPREDLQRNYYYGEGQDINCCAGMPFTLSEHPHNNYNQDYYLAAIVYHAQCPSDLSADQVADHPPVYRNHFIAYPSTQNFTPVAAMQVADERRESLIITEPSLMPLPAITQPCITGVHLATVVGPKGKKIYTDKYGRVKVQFSWDTKGKHDENSFAWVRVKQSWGGMEYGFHATPRIGQQVVVSFEHGDPEKPLIIGAMPTDNHRPPFTPEKTPTQSGFQSQSFDSAAAGVGGHQFMFEDDATKPAVKIHAQRDMQLRTKGDFTHTIGGNSTTTVHQGNHVQFVNGRLTIEAKKAIHLVNGQSRISVTDTDIIVEANKINIGNFGGMKSEKENDPAPKKILEEMFPALSLDLAQLAEIKGMIVFEDKPFIYEANLSGNVTLQKQGSYSPATFSLNDYKLEARSTLGSFFANLALHPSSHEEMILGSQVTGEFVSSSFQIITVRPEHVRFESSPSPIEKTFLGWKISGNLVFTVDLYDQNPLSAMLPSNAPVFNHQIEAWHNIKKDSLAAGIIALGVLLAPIIERLALAALVVVV